MSKLFKVRSKQTGKETVKTEDEVTALKSSEKYVAGRFEITEIQPAAMPKEVADAMKPPKP